MSLVLNTKPPNILIPRHTFNIVNEISVCIVTFVRLACVIVCCVACVSWLFLGRCEPPKYELCAQITLLVITGNCCCEILLLLRLSAVNLIGVTYTTQNKVYTVCIICPFYYSPMRE